jgi:hypothetical protein
VITLTPTDGGKDVKATLLRPSKSDKPAALTSTPDGVHWALQPAEDGFALEAAIPVAQLPAPPAMRGGSRFSFRLAYEGNKTGVATSEAPARFWPYLKLVDAK